MWVVALLTLTTAALLLILWSVKRRKRPRLALQAEADLHDLVPSIAGLTQDTLVEGNRVTLLHHSGASWGGVFEELAGAKETINVGHAREIDPSQRGRRSLWHRTIDLGRFLFNEQL